LRVVTKDEKLGNSHISILFPGKAWGIEDSGIGSIGRIDQAHINAGTTIKMHPHVNDDILSYFRKGKVIHTDSAQHTETISRKKLMLMKAGKVFFHEEKIVEDLEGLQIFIRPGIKDAKPEVIFYDLESEDSLNQWRCIASFQPDASLIFSSKTEIYDIQIDDSVVFSTPRSMLEDRSSILYVFQGEIYINETQKIKKGECVLFDESSLSFYTKTNAEIVLFHTDTKQDCFKGGMFSGIQSL
jgi:quercetin 2,3-dioxygenase